MNKSCLHCSSIFERKKSCGSIARWEKQLFCSVACSLVNRNKSNIGRKISEETKAKMSKARLGRPATRPVVYVACAGCGVESIRKGSSKKYCNKDCRLKHSPYAPRVPRPNKTAENHHNWKGGVTSQYNKDRKSLDYKIWRENVFDRDNNCCVNCGSQENLRADHIKPFSLYPELRFDVNNGRVLCRECDNKIGYQIAKTEKNPTRKLNVFQVEEIKLRLRNGEGRIEIAKIYNVSLWPIDNIRKKMIKGDSN